MFIVLPSESTAGFEHFSFNTGGKEGWQTKKEHSYGLQP